MTRMKVVMIVGMLWCSDADCLGSDKVASDKIL